MEDVNWFKNFLSGSISRKIFISFFLLITIPILILSILSFSISSNVIEKISIEFLQSSASFKANSILDKFDNFKNDLFFLSSVPPIDGMKSAENNGGIDPNSGASFEDWRIRLENIFLEMGNSNKEYFQIRYLDKLGNEIVRVDSFNGSFKATSKENLQYKGDRDYFLELSKVPKGDFYYSKFELNREGNPPKISSPETLTFRLGIPLFDEDNNFYASILVNFYASEIFQLYLGENSLGENSLRIEKSLSEGREIILDSKGFYLFGEESSKLYGGKNDLDTRENLFRDSPDLFYEVVVPRAGSVLKKDNIVIHFPIIYDKDSSVFLIYLIIVPLNVFFEDISRLKIIFLGIGIIFVFLSFGISFFFSKSISLPIKKLFFANKELIQGNFNQKLSIDSKDEFGLLEESFNRVAKSLKITDQERKEIDNAKTEFLSITSHELRSPMTPMKAQLQMLLKEYYGKISPSQKEALEIVERNTSRLDKIIVDFLEISRIESARLKFRFVKVSLEKYIRRLIVEMKGFMPEKNIQFILEMDKLPVIEVDPDRTMQVLRNLLNNAVKFSRNNSKIKIRVLRKKDHFLFSIQDNGIGISKKDQQRIFEPFYQAEQTIFREHSGTGLGLAICRGIVESQGGKILVRSKKGEGTKFVFTLPFKQIKKIKSIKLLFSSQLDLEKKVLELFKNLLGPVGNVEFESLKEKKGINEEELSKYLQILKNKGILSESDADNFKLEINKLFKGDLKDK